MRKRLIIAFLVMGSSGIVAQILLLRELLVSFYGNELSIGIILANWLILEAFGCFLLGKSIERVMWRLEAYVGFQLLFSLFFPVAIYLTRILKEIIGVTPGEGLGLLPILYSSFFILLPVSVLHGALFTFGCKLYSLVSREDASSISKVYVYETLGTIAGGVFLTYLLIPNFGSLQIAFGVALLNIILCVWLLGPFRRTTEPASTRGLAGRALPCKILWFVSLAALGVFTWITFGPKADQIHQLSIRQQWPNQEVLHYQNSVYGNVVVTKKEAQYTFFSDGIPVISTPVPDITFVEEFAHIPLLAHPQPKDVLIISSGAGGLINEILKHPVERVDYTELDPLILEVVEKFYTELTKAEFSDPRVRIEYMDGRLFLKKSSYRYDLILVGPSLPSDLQVNRLFTKEFFWLAKEKLKEDGILAISLPGSLTYLSEELRKLNACILGTLKGVYPYVRIIPGDFNLFLASASGKVSQITPQELNQRLAERALDVKLLVPAHIEYRLHPRWLKWFLSSLEGIEERRNEDFLPIGAFYALSYWNALFSPYMRAAFRWFERVNLWFFIIPLSILTLAILFVRVLARGASLPEGRAPAPVKRIDNALARATIPLCILTTGFAGMIFDLALIFTFQSLYGYVYYQVGLLVTALMAGIAVGALSMMGSLERIKSDFGAFIKLEVAIILYSAALPVVFLVLSPYLGRPVIFLLLQVIFLILSFLSGLLIGAEFPLANKIYLRISPNLSGTAGLLYGADLFGGWIGGVIGGVVLLPVLGLLKTCMAVVALKIASLIILATSSRKLGPKST